MPRYHWADDDIVNRVDIKESLHYPYAILRFREGVDVETLSDIPRRLQSHGLVAIPDTENDKPILRIRHFNKATELFEQLHREGLNTGHFKAKEPLPEEVNKEVRTWRKYIKEYSIPLSGAVYLIADAMPIFSGIVRKTPSEVSQGVMWATTSAALLLYGKKNPDRQIGNMYAAMRDYFEKEGVDLTDDQGLALQQMKTGDSYYNAAINWLYENPVLFNNSLQGLGGFKQLQAGTAQANWYKQAAGAGVMAGQWGSLIIPEDKFASLSPEERAEKLQRVANGEDPEGGLKATLFGDPVNWVHERPLRLITIGPILGNFLTAAAAMFKDRHDVNQYFGYASNQYEFRPGQLLNDFTRNEADLLRHSGLDPTDPRTHDMLKTHTGSRFTMMTPVFNIIANTLYGISSKEDRSVNLDKEGYLDEVISMAANVYALMPEEHRDRRVVRFAGFLANQHDVDVPYQKIKQRIDEKIESLRTSAWARAQAKADGQELPEAPSDDKAPPPEGSVVASDREHKGTLIAQQQMHHSAQPGAVG